MSIFLYVSPAAILTKTFMFRKAFVSLHAALSRKDSSGPRSLVRSQPPFLFVLFLAGTFLSLVFGFPMTIWARGAGHPRGAYFFFPDVVLAHVFNAFDVFLDHQADGRYSSSLPRLAL